MVTPAFPKNVLVRLWKHVFNRPQEPLTKYAHRPHYFGVGELANKNRDVLRHALQCEFPNLFIPLSACTEPILRALYERFALEEYALDTEICEGVHYFWIQDDEPEDHQANELVEPIKRPEPQADALMAGPSSEVRGDESSEFL